jgi:two-component system cell cycle response regulator
MTQSRTDPPARVLVVDDEPQHRDRVEVMLRDKGYEVLLARRGEEALVLAHESRPDLIILDLMMSGLSGFEVCARVKMDPQTGGVPVLFMMGPDETGFKERALAAGADDFLAKPTERAELSARVEALLKVRDLNRGLDRALAYFHELDLTPSAEQLRTVTGRSDSEAGQGVVLVVDDEPLVRELFNDVLQGAGYVTHEAADGPQAVDIARRESIDAVLLDIMMPNMSGLEVLAKLGQLAPDSPVIIVTAHPTSENAIAAVRLGAFDFLAKGVENEVILATVARAMERRRLVMRDRTLISQLEAKIQSLLAILAERGYGPEQPGGSRLQG